MKKRLRNYTGENIDVSYEADRCIHVADCVRRLNAVFDRDKCPWVQPDAASPNSVAATVVTCPSGALHYERKDGGVEVLPTSLSATIRIKPSVLLRLIQLPNRRQLSRNGTMANYASKPRPMARCISPAVSFS